MAASEAAIQAAHNRWKAKESSRAYVESDDFIQDALRQLGDMVRVSEFEENVKQSGTWASEIDERFANVTNNFEEIVEGHGKDFLELGNYLDEWKGLNQQWVEHLLMSREVATEHGIILRRFDRWFLDMILHIDDQEDRLDAIIDLEEFILEKHDKPQKMSQAWPDLRREIRSFVSRLDHYIKELGVELNEAARILRAQIGDLAKEILVLEREMHRSRLMLTLGGTFLTILGIVSAETPLENDRKERDAKDEKRRQKQDELNKINPRQDALAFLKIDVGNLQPYTDLICERLFLFSEVWASVQVQSTQFREHLKGGMDAVTKTRFRREVQLAQAATGPLIRGLDAYSAELGSRLVRTGHLTVEQLFEEKKALFRIADQIKRWSEQEPDPRREKGRRTGVQKDPATRERVKLERMAETLPKN
ncbi:hypothetical protein DFP72DRAFT_83772 [Ephemerocybe angulata]|uniref:Uncharacterized protein n=1 Tax=Ephemerocybe angulata TaxID=980116 RepID=A0A8H6HE97_9AGAR|nr:hypothetical protein DFP72DRAFT_83772 [Tulosesus angulatus]